MEKPYFVMLLNQDGSRLIPMLSADDDGQLAMFGTVDEAELFGKNNPLGKAFGYEVHESGMGIVSG